MSMPNAGQMSTLYQYLTNGTSAAIKVREDSLRRANRCLDALRIAAKQGYSCAKPLMVAELLDGGLVVSAEEWRPGGEILQGDDAAHSCRFPRPPSLVDVVVPRRRSWDTPPMSTLPVTFVEDVINQPIRIQFEAFLNEHRLALNDCLNGLTEEQVRRSLVPSRTTLMGLVKHATFVERVWFDEAITCRPRAEIGIPATPDESFILDEDDTIATVQQAHLEACESSRRGTSSLGLDDMLNGNRRGPLPLRWVYLHMLRELAQHCGHADILREQLLS